MLKLIICEFAKLKRKKLFLAAFLTTFIMPLFYSLLLTSPDLDNIMSAVREDTGFLVLIPLLVVIAANLFFEEYDYDTLKNLLSIPVKKGRLAAAKLLVLLLFAIAYQLAGYGISLFLAAVSGAALDGWGLQLWLTLATGILIWSAAMPCILFVVWSHKSYIISVIIAFAYMTVSYILHLTEMFIMVPLGLNLATFLPVSIIFRWLYQFHSLEGAGTAMLEFYNRFRPYFVPTYMVFTILLAEGTVCTALIMKIYKKQD